MISIENLEKELKNNHLNSMYLLYGEELFLLETSLKKIKTLFNSTVKEIFKNEVCFTFNDKPDELKLKIDLTYVFAGGILPTSFLEGIGIKISKKFGDALLKH